MKNRSWNLIQERYRYLTIGNFHGISANWLAKQNTSLFSSVNEFAASPECPVNLMAKEIEVGESLFRQVVVEKSGLNYRKNFDCEMGLASFLYAYIISHKPAVVIETGIANGITTNVIMKALEKNGGVLHSFDVDPRTQNVYSGGGNWKFHLLRGDFETDLRTQAFEIGAVDLWIHDSDHGYRWQTFEYHLANSLLTPGGLLVSDDIDSSTAWGLTANTKPKKSFGIFDARKFFGVSLIN